MAIVHCRNSTGLFLRLYEKIDGPLGIVEHRATGERVELRPGPNEVDDDFWRKWAEANKGSSLFDLLSVGPAPSE